jgi:hypothetical protein
MTERVLLGPFLTRVEAGRRSGLAEEDVLHRPDLLRVGGRMYKEAYFAFQFGRTGVRRDVGSVVLAMRGRVDDVTIADWLVRSTSSLLGSSPLSWMNRGGNLESVLSAAATSGPAVAESVAGRGG